MTERDEPLDPGLESMIRELKAPVDLGPSVDRRVLAIIRADAPPRVLRFRRRIIALTGLAAAAVVALVVMMNYATAPASQVRFAIRQPEARSISVVGDFNDWDPALTPLERSRGGEWQVKLELPPGRYRYSYLVDGDTWVADPGRPAVPDADFEAPTSLITVQDTR